MYVCFPFEIVGRIILRDGKSKLFDVLHSGNSILCVTYIWIIISTNTQESALIDPGYTRDN